MRGEGREELESGSHGFHGEKPRHAQLLAAGGEEIRERKGQVSIRGGGGGSRSATDTCLQLTKEKAAAAAYTVVGAQQRGKWKLNAETKKHARGGEEEKRSGFVIEPRRGFGEEYGEERASGENVLDYGAKGMVGDPRGNVEEEEAKRDTFKRRELEREGVLGAIGETIAEIAKTTTNLVIGDPPGRTHDHGATDYMEHKHGHR